MRSAPWNTATSTNNVDDIVVADSEAKNREAALADAIRKASNTSGQVRKLIVNDVSVGDGREVKVGDTATVHYIGMVRDGAEFDNSYKKGQPLSFKVGAGEVIAGWEQGIIGMKEGGKRILIVPPEMGYGNAVVDPIPANATLLFSIELLSIE
ncbi:FKBP-type peptidyl-prolyl cis-trans isomerase [Candidatus Kaiserbacteria bacterium]|nr:FKBP-type peptidyl-prolyl cis-trans isomerase [Candidatus Kaiserbacteria bacterium]